MRLAIAFVVSSCNADPSVWMFFNVQIGQKAFDLVIDKSPVFFVIAVCIDGAFSYLKYVSHVFMLYSDNVGGNMAH